LIPLLNNTIVVGIAGLIADRIRKRYQMEAENAQKKREWCKQTQAKQEELFNELSRLAARVVGETRMLVMELAGSVIGDLENTNINSRKETWTKSIMEWNNSSVSNYHKIQNLTLPKKSDSAKPKQKLTAKSEPKSAAELFKQADFKEEILIVGKKGEIEDKTTLVSSIWILSNVISHNLPKFQTTLKDILGEKDKNQGLVAATMQALDNLDNLDNKVKDIHGIIEKIRKILAQDDEKKELETWLLDKDTEPFCSYKKWLDDDKLNDDDKKLISHMLWLLDKYKEIFELLVEVDKKIPKFFQALDRGFQAKLEHV
jgi:hypothetical protein